MQDTPGDHEEQGGEEGQSEGDCSSGIDVAPEPSRTSNTSSCNFSSSGPPNFFANFDRAAKGGAGWGSPNCLQTLDTHPDKGGNPEAFLFLEEQCRIVRHWLKEFEEKIESLGFFWKASKIS